jgi:hypothetical protein
LSEDALFREVDEDVRQEQYQKIWDRYGNIILGVAFLVVAGVGGFKAWGYWQLKQSQEAATAYFAAEQKAADGKTEEAAKDLAAIVQPGFGQFAKLKQAALLARSGKSDEAIKLYDAIVADRSADQTLRDLAAIREGYLLADSATPDQLLTRLGAYDKDDNPWRFAAREIFGLAAYRTSDFKMAQTYFSALFTDPGTPAQMRQRAQALVQLVTPMLGKK